MRSASPLAFHVGLALSALALVGCFRGHDIGFEEGVGLDVSDVGFQEESYTDLAGDCPEGLEFSTWEGWERWEPEEWAEVSPPLDRDAGAEAFRLIEDVEDWDRFVSSEDPLLHGVDFDAHRVVLASYIADATCDAPPVSIHVGYPDPGAPLHIDVALWHLDATCVEVCEAEIETTVVLRVPRSEAAEPTVCRRVVMDCL